MTNQEILQIALQQSAYDCNCDSKDFLQDDNKIVLSEKTKMSEFICHFLLNAIWCHMVIISLHRLTRE